MTNRNLPRLLGNDERNGIGFVAKTKSRAVTQAEVPVEILALGEGENAGGGNDAVAADDHAAIVKHCLGLEHGEGEFL